MSGYIAQNAREGRARHRPSKPIFSPPREFIARAPALVDEGILASERSAPRRARHTHLPAQLSVEISSLKDRLAPAGLGRLRAVNE